MSSLFAVLPLLAAMTSADAIATLLNSPSSASAAKFAAAKAMVEREAAEGRPLQQFVVGVTTDDRDLAKRYVDGARDKIRKIAEAKNNALAWYLLSMESNDLSILQKAADGGNVQALNALGSITMQRVLDRKDATREQVDAELAKSFACFRKAVLQRDPNGFVNLGACYSRGLGCKRDLDLAFACFRSAAEMGHPEGMDNLSACYQLGHGVEKSETLSLYWLMRARALRGDEAAKKWLRERK